ncbi:MAG: hypothetical protein DMF88_08020 [Acidobacteria bacterium]|nr:MAG: hypothetical protein DMF88_08020 [Acidobacteriota bacterium]
MMSTIWSWITGPTFTGIAALASVASLLLTIWVALGVYRLKASYLFSARAPQLAKQLRNHAANLAEYLNDFKAFEDKIREELAATEVTALSLARKIDWRRRRTVKQLGKAIKRMGKKQQFSEAELREVYVQLVKVNEHVKDLQADLKWER